MIIAYVPLFVALLGLLLYALASNAKVQECGRLMFFAGMLVFLFTVSGKTIRFLR